MKSDRTDRLRVVIDTNHIMSAILSNRGASAKLIDYITAEEDVFELLLTSYIWDEYTTVAAWLIPQSLQNERERILTTLRMHSQWIETSERLTACSDEADNRFLECAVEGHADFLVTKNIKHFPYKEFNGVRIVRIRQFLEVLERKEGG